MQHAKLAPSAHSREARTIEVDGMSTVTTAAMQILAAKAPNAYEVDVLWRARRHDCSADACNARQPESAV